jgi:hypothetical protein
MDEVVPQGIATRAIDENLGEVEFVKLEMLLNLHRAQGDLWLLTSPKRLAECSALEIC